MNANGNLTARGADTFGYDQANRLKTASVAGVSSSYAYDGDGKRSSKSVAAANTAYTYDVNASLPILLDDGVRKYVWGLGLAFAVDSSANPILYHQDGLGSVRALTDSSGGIVQTYLYDEYGVVVSRQGSISQPFGYTGEQRDSETGLVHLRARYYDPYLNRFIQSDPIVANSRDPLALNRYINGLDNPLKCVDPSGLSSSQALNDGSTDNDCLTSAGGALGGNVVSVTCLNMFGQTVAFGVVRAGNILVPAVSVLQASPPPGGGGDDVMNRLKPSGRLIGKAGTSSRIRIVRGGAREPRRYSMSFQGEVQSKTRRTMKVP